MHFAHLLKCLVTAVFLLATKPCKIIKKLNSNCFLYCLQSVTAKIFTLACLGAPNGQGNTTTSSVCTTILSSLVQQQNTNSKHAVDSLSLSCAIRQRFKTPLFCGPIHCHLDSEVQDKVDGPSSILGLGW